MINNKGKFLQPQQNAGFARYFAGPYKTVARLFRGVLYITCLPGRARLGIMALPDVYWVVLFIAGVAGQVIKVVYLGLL